MPAEVPTMLTVKRTTGGNIALVAWYSDASEPLAVLLPNDAVYSVTQAMRSAQDGYLAQTTLVFAVDPPSSLGVGGAPKVGDPPDEAR